MTATVRPQRIEEALDRHRWRIPSVVIVEASTNLLLPGRVAPRVLTRLVETLEQLARDADSRVSRQMERLAQEFVRVH